MPELKVGSPRCQCTACGEYFSSPTPFDMHRIWSPQRSRGCKTPEQMLGDGMAKDKYDFWISRENNGYD